MLVWNMKTEQWVELKSWMRYCDIYSKVDKKGLRFTDEFWDQLKESERK